MKSAYYELPYPPSVNNYLISDGKGGRTLSPVVRAYRDEVRYAVLKSPNRTRFGKDCRVRLIVEAYPPNKKRYDTDNGLKSLLDSLQAAFVLEDDNVVYRIEIERMKPTPPGMVKVWLEEVV